MYYGYYPYFNYPQGYYQYPYPYEQPVYPEIEDSRYHQPLPVEEMERQGDQGGQPYVFNIEHATERNRAFRRAIWTGHHLQLTLMRIMPGEDIGLEVHPHTDQFLGVEDGRGVVQMGPRRNQLTFERRVREDDAILVPAGTWHNIINTGRNPLLLYSIYAPPEHAKGTVQHTKQAAIEQHRDEE